MKVVLVFGTRPEIIKIHPVYTELIRRGYEVKIIYTKQNFTKELSEDIFKEFYYDTDDFIDNRSFAADYVLVQGDTWSTLEGVLLAGNNNVRVGHIEAGIRSDDYRMVEEKIRILVDQYSDFHFCPTDIAAKNIERELGIIPFTVGNTIADVMNGEKRGEPKFLTVTLHRPETVDHKETLAETLNGIDLVRAFYDLPIKFFVHPRTQSKMQDFGLDFNFPVMPSVERSRFMDILKRSRLVITDSGGVQEEAAILKVPCVTARLSTERPETITAGLNVIAGNTSRGIFEAAKNIVRSVENEDYIDKPLYGENVAPQIVDILEGYE